MVADNHHLVRAGPVDDADSVPDVRIRILHFIAHRNLRLGWAG